MKPSFPRTMTLLLVLVTWATAGVYAQVNTATLSGVVTDQSGAAIPGAILSLKNPATGVVRSAKSTVDGRFTYTFVPIGVYELSADHPGFQHSTLEAINLTASMSLELSVKMNVQRVQTSVIVSGNQEALQTVTSEQTSTVPEKQLSDLPVQNQNWVNLIALDPSVATSGQGITFNGLPPVSYTVTVDGTNATSDPEFNDYQVYGAPNIINTVGNDAIAEVSVVKGISPATIGGAMSANINIITKSGTNQFHGGLYEINEVSLYDARNQFLTSRPRLTFNQFGGSVGGPILRDRFFFFGNYEGARSFSLASISGTVPSPYLKSISPPVYAPLLAIYPSIEQPASNPTALVGTYHGSASRQQKDGSGLVRLDGSINSANQVAVRYIRSRPQLVIPSLIPINPQTYSGHVDSVNANYLHIGHMWTSNARFGFNQIKLTRINPGFNQKLNSFAFAGFGSASITGGMYKGFFQHGNYTTYEEAIGLVRGKHTIQLGGIVQRQNASRYIVQTPGVTYSTLSDYLANIPSNVILELYTIPAGQPPFGFINYWYGGYVQDDYRVTSKLTLNLGIRYDYFTVPREYAGRFYNRGVDPAHPQLGAGFGPYRPADSIFDADYGGFQPRLGFAWQVKQNLVLHGGFAIMKVGHNFFSGPVNLTQVSPTLPFSVGLNRAQALAAALNYPVDPLAFPQQITDLQQEGVLSTNLPNTTTVPAYNPNPYSIGRFLGIQQALPGGIHFTIDYVGNAGVQLSTFETKNLPNRTTGAAPVPNFGEFTQNGVGDHSNYNALQTKVESQVSNGLFLGAAYAFAKTLAYSDVGILQPSQPQDPDDFKAEYGRAIFDVRNVFTAEAVWEIPFDQMKFAHGNAARALVKGWQVSATFTGQTGLPANPHNSASSYPADRPDANPGVAQYLSGWQEFPGSHQYLNRAAFVEVPLSPSSGAQIRGGDLGRNSLRTPGSEILNASLTKTFSITGGLHIRLRAEAFNAFNHTNLGGLQSNIAASNFGQLTSASPRTMQIEARITF